MINKIMGVSVLTNSIHTMDAAVSGRDDPETWTRIVAMRQSTVYRCWNALHGKIGVRDTATKDEDLTKAKILTSIIHRSTHIAHF